MKKKEKYTLTFLLFFSIITFYSCSKVNTTSLGSLSKQEITINIENEPASLDPRRARLMTDYSLIQTFNDGLFRKGKDNQIVEAVAKSYTISDDGLVYTFNLKETLWSNKDPLTANDFIYAWKTALDRTFPSPSASLLFPIKNAKAIKEGSLPASMLGVYALDDYTLVVELEKKLPFFISLLCLPIFNPINSLIEKENPLWYTDASTYVCNGPFKLSSWKHTNEIIAQKNNEYWDKDAVRLEKIKMVMVDSELAHKMFEHNELNWAGSPYSTVPSDVIKSLNDQKILKKKPLLGTYFIRTNTNIFPLKDINFRKALAISINREALIEHVLEKAAEVATGIIPTSMGLQDTPYFNDGDKNQALSFLAKSFSLLDISKKTTPSLTLTYASSTRNHKIAQALQDMWKKTLDLTIRLEPLEQKVYLDKISRGDYQLACGSWIADFEDPISFLEVFKYKSIGTNNTNWESLDYINAIESSYTLECKSKRNLALKNAEKILVDAMVILPVFHYTMFNLQDTELCDVSLSNLGMLDFKWAYIKK